MELGALPLNTHEISEQPLECTAGKTHHLSGQQNQWKQQNIGLCLNPIQIPSFRGLGNADFAFPDPPKRAREENWLG